MKKKLNKKKNKATKKITKKIRLEEMNWREIENLDKEKTVIVIPISPLEAHGPHLPVGTDILVTEEISKELAKNINKKRKDIIPVLYPTQAFGYCGANKDVPGSVSVDVRVFGREVYDTLKSLASVGFRYIIIITFHLDPFYIKAINRAIRKIERKKSSIRIAEPLSRIFYNDKMKILHAGKEETSIMLYLYPYLVDKKYKSLKKVEINFSIMKFRKTLRELGAEDAYIGNPSEASIELGRELFMELLDFCTNSILELLNDEYKNTLPRMLKFLPLSLQRK